MFQKVIEICVIYKGQHVWCTHYQKFPQKVNAHVHCRWQLSFLFLLAEHQSGLPVVCVLHKASAKPSPVEWRIFWSEKPGMIKEWKVCGDHWRLQNKQLHLCSLTSEVTWRQTCVMIREHDHFTQKWKKNHTHEYSSFLAWMILQKVKENRSKRQIHFVAKNLESHTVFSITCVFHNLVDSSWFEQWNVCLSNK